MNEYQKRMKQILYGIKIELFTICIFLTAGVCRADVVFARMEARQPMAITQARIDKERQVQQKKHLKQLREFCYKIFEDDLISSYRRQRSISFSEIRKRFGEPIKTEREEWPYWDPDPTGPPTYYVHIWNFEGLLLEMGEHTLSESRTVLLLDRVVINSPMYPLKHGLRVGQAVSKFIDVLGKPTRKYKDRNELIYEYKDDVSDLYDGITQINVCEVSLTLDVDDKVQRIQWGSEERGH